METEKIFSPIFPTIQQLLGKACRSLFGGGRRILWVVVERRTNKGARRMCRAPFRALGRSKRDYLTSTSALWGFAPNPLLGVSRRARARQFADMSSAALSRSLCLGIAAPRATTNAGHRPASPRRGKVHGEGETPAGGGKPSAYPPSDSESRSDALAGVQFVAKRT